MTAPTAEPLVAPARAPAAASEPAASSARNGSLEPRPEPAPDGTLPRSYRLIVVGSGISGLFVALEARRLGPVLVLTKGSVDDTNTRWAQGGIAAAVGPLDSVDTHLRDTIEAGAGIVDEAAARVLCEEAPGRIRDLVDYGVAFDSLRGEVALGREAAHSWPRILHAGGDRTGAAIETALSTAAHDPSITILDYAMATRLLVERGAVVGVEAVDLRTGEMETYEAPAVMLATGGAGQLFRHTTNDVVATGDGIALAFNAGAEVADLEFYQFHPTALKLEGQPPFLISEAMRGDGAVLRNVAGEAFMARYDERAELAPRDVVSRAIVAEMASESADRVLLDCTGMGSVDLATRFPGIYAFCRAAGIAIEREAIPVAPAAHYLMGGVRTDTHGRTTVPGLYACGEVACTGVHGANRLASNSLMETVVFGKRAVEQMERGEGGSAAPTPDATRIGQLRTAGHGHACVQEVGWRYAGIARSGEGLAHALNKLRAWPTPSTEPTREAIEQRQMTEVLGLMLESALARTESRGAHYRTDHPERDDHAWMHHQVLRSAD